MTKTPFLEVIPRAGFLNYFLFLVKNLKICNNMVNKLIFYVRILIDNQGLSIKSLSTSGKDSLQSVRLEHVRYFNESNYCNRTT